MRHQKMPFTESTKGQPLLKRHLAGSETPTLCLPQKSFICTGWQKRFDILSLFCVWTKCWIFLGWVGLGWGGGGGSAVGAICRWSKTRDLYLCNNNDTNATGIDNNNKIQWKNNKMNFWTTEFACDENKIWKCNAIKCEKWYKKASVIENSIYCSAGL